MEKGYKFSTSLIPLVLYDWLLQEFVESLDRDKQVELLCKLLSMGRGSLDFAKDAVAQGIPEQPSPSREQPPGVSAIFAGRWNLSKKMFVVRNVPA